jgi:hypothetical protein
MAMNKQSKRIVREWHERQRKHQRLLPEGFPAGETDNSAGRARARPLGGGDDNTPNPVVHKFRPRQ